MVRTRPSACKMCNTKAGMISHRGFCKKCGDKAIVAGGKRGGHSGIGDAKRRAHSNNGRFTPQRQDYKTWKSLDLKISDFEFLLRKLHEGRERGQKQPWLRASNLSTSLSSISNIDDIVRVLCETRFCHPDRYEDYVSKEVRCAMRRSTTKRWRVAIALGVRYSQSPRGLAAALANTSTTADFMEQLSCFKRAKAYRQTGIPCASLGGVLAVSSDICRHSTFRSFDDLEDYIASRMTYHCRGCKDEQFSARQAALDICGMKFLCHGLSSQKRPHFVRMGPGAKAGFYHSCRAEHQKARAPKKVLLTRQTTLCEYSKLVKRLNFPKLQRLHRYTSTR